MSVYVVHDLGRVSMQVADGGDRAGIMLRVGDEFVLDVQHAVLTMGRHGA